MCKQQLSSIVQYRDGQNSTISGEDAVGRIRIDTERIPHHVSEIGRIR